MRGGSDSECSAHEVPGVTWSDPEMGREKLSRGEMGSRLAQSSSRFPRVIPFYISVNKGIKGGEAGRCPLDR